MLRVPRYRTAFGLVAIGFVTWVVLAARGPRGSDQYWYVGDVAVEHSTGLRATNHIYPLAVPDASQGRLPVRMHDLPMTDLATWLSNTGLPAYSTWVALNVASLIIAALLVLAGARVIVRQSGEDRAWLAPLVFLALPASTWFAVNALVEATIALGVALCLAGWAWWRSGHIWGLLVQAVGASVLLLHRENFVLVGMASIAAVIFVGWRRDRGWAVGSVAVVLSAGVLSSALFKSYPNAGLLGTLMVGAPGAKSNMDFYYSDVPFNARGFAGKAVANAYSALVPSGASDVVISLPCLVLFIAGLVLAVRRKETWLAALFVVGGVVWFTTCIVFQPQARYAFMLAPLGAATFPALFEEATRTLRVRVGRFAGIVVICGALAASLFLAHTYRVDAIADRDTISEMSAMAGMEPEGAVMSTGGSAVDIPLAYSVAPRQMLSVDPRLNSPQEVAAWMRSLNVRVIFGFDSDEAFIQRLPGELGNGSTIRPIGESPSPGGQVRAWEVQKAP